MTMPWVFMNGNGGYRTRRRRRRATRRRTRTYGGYNRVYSRSNDYDDDFDGDSYADNGTTRISVVDQRGRPVGVAIQGQNIRDMQPPYEDRSIYATTRRRSRF